MRCYAAPGRLRASFAFGRSHERLTQRLQREASAGLAMPSLIVGGQSSMADLMAGVRGLGGNVVHDVVPGSGHYIPEENPGWFTSRLITFLDTAGGTGRSAHPSDQGGGNRKR